MLQVSHYEVPPFSQKGVRSISVDLFVSDLQLDESVSFPIGQS